MKFKEAVREFQLTNDRTVIERIISHLQLDFLAGESLTEPEHYIAIKVKAQIWPYLRNARKVRRGTKTAWYRFMDLINGDDYHADGFIGLNKKYGLNLTRENNYQIPLYIKDQMSEDFLAETEEAIDFWNELHRKEDEMTEELYNEALCNWAVPALEYAMERVDTERSDREMVSYINRAFYTKYVELRATSQGLVRKREDGRWVYYQPKQDFDEDNYRNQEIMQMIFKRKDFRYPEAWDRFRILTRRQYELLGKVEEVIREDIRRNDPAYFRENYNHGQVKYTYMATKLEMSYEAFIKNMQRIEKSIFVGKL
ncbi:hypothetical protein D0469_03500 [Peribacillus saganii]|uniref:Uncharacterized protein n=1 Tax=Peribacillus saganii TaxID=2303992 RepID=A0A372LS57_9BACI|nr:hypothetical protein [Peribacillus saganii]RFU71018.1 hypothetical protein D0469_03500 [Peribacillus saganii]